MMSERNQHIEDLIPDYLNETLNQVDRARVDDHLRSCVVCQRQLDEWRSISMATVEAYDISDAPSAAVLSNIKSRIASPVSAPIPGAQPAPSFGLQHLWQLVVGQIRLVHGGIWLAAPLTLFLGLLPGLMARSVEALAVPIALIAPALAAVSLALIYGPENDPSLELALATPTSPRLVLLARMTLVFGYDLLIASAATAILVTIGNGSALWPLISMWVVPMLFLSAFAMAMSLHFGTSAAIAASLVLWAMRVYAFAEVELNLRAASETAEMLHGFWESGVLLIALAVCLLIITLLMMPRQERFA